MPPVDDCLPQGYVDGTYLDNTGGTWHAEDGPWKAEKLGVALEHERTILACLGRSSSAIRLVDLGCGSGAALSAAIRILAGHGLIVDAVGVDPAGDAVEVAGRLFPSLRVIQGTLVDAPAADLLMLFDVIEHLVRPDDFLREAVKKARFIALHIPVEESVWARLRGLREQQRVEVGHLHFYHRWSALRLLRGCGLEILGWEYTSSSAEGRRPSTTARGRVVDKLRRRAFLLSPDAAAHTVGGCGLMVLCRGALA